MHLPVMFIHMSDARFVGCFYHLVPVSKAAVTVGAHMSSGLFSWVYR